jgi:hypothetical protein
MVLVDIIGLIMMNATHPTRNNKMTYDFVISSRLLKQQNDVFVR